MSEFERTRLRERERPPVDLYDLQLKKDQEFAQRQLMGRIVVKMTDCVQQQSRQGLLRFYLDNSIKDTPLQTWIVFTHEIRTQSGKHRHQGGLVIYVIDGVGYSVVDGERIDWSKGDLLLLPLRKGGVEHQHFNVDPAKPALWIAFIHAPTREYLASEMTQTEASPDYKQRP